MSFQIIDVNKPTGTRKKKFGDDDIREFKSQVVAALQTISNYPNSDHPIISLWADDTKPTINLKDGIFGFNTDKKQLEVCFDGTLISASGRMIGEIVLWGGAEADIATICNPLGFYLCNGEHGTVDLSDKFIVAAGATRTHKSTAGADAHTHTTGDVTLTIEQIPEHVHSGGGSGSLPEHGDNEDNDNYIYRYTGNTGSAGGGLPHNHGATSSVSNVPVYYALCFIQKVS
jgi:hypothetical protein